MTSNRAARPAEAHRMHSTGTPEMDLLVCAARVRLEPPWEERMRTLLAGPIAWPALLGLAQRHRMVPLLDRHLKRMGPASVPPEVLDALGERAAHIVRRSLLLTAELREVLRLFAGHGVAALAYKGPALAHALYGDAAFRDIGDLDLLVHRHEVDRARALLGSRGFEPAVSLTAQQDRSVLRSDSNYPLVREDRGVVVELHWTPESGLGPDALAGLWARAERVPLPGLELRTFSRPDLLLLLAMHGGRHMWERLEWICGVAELLRGSELAWPRVLRLAAELGGRRSLLVALTLADRLLGAPVPAAIGRQAGRDRAVERLVAAATEHLLRREPQLAHRLGWQFHDFQLRSRERLRDRARYVWRRTFSPSKDDFAALPLPDWLFPLYVPLRPLRLAGRYIHRSRSHP